VQAYIGKLVDSSPVLQPEVERALLMLNDIPGVAARAAFTPGASTGAAEMVVSVAEDEPLELRAEINNHGTRSTGVLRAGLGLQLRDVFGWGDSISARGLVSRGGASLTRLRYELAGDFRALGGVGTADALALDASYALRRSIDTNVTARASYEHKRLRDELQQLLDTLVIKRNDIYELAFSFDDRDAIGGTSAGSLALAFGSLQQGDTREPWRRLSAQLARQQALFGPLSLYLRATGQTTGSPLDSSEKLALAGPGAVRAYAAGEATVDRGAVTTVELRYAHDYLGGGLVWSVFHDQAKGEISRAQVGLPGNRLSLHGSGLALSWSGSGVGVNAALAWRGSRLPTVDGADPSPRVILQVFYTP
jgi:hemolysin activation/secretion protein